MKHQEIWEQYVASWKADSAEAKQALFERCLTPDCVYTDPLGRRAGQSELLAYMLEFQQQVAGGHFVTETFYAHHGRCAAKWTMRDGAGQAIGDGVSFGEYGPDGRLTSMTGFFDTPG